MNEQLLGLAEIADLYAIDKSTASNWSRTRDFPEPRYKLKMGPIWTLGQLENWRIPARTVKITDETDVADLPPAFIVATERDYGLSGHENNVVVVVKCPFCPKKHRHGTPVGPRVPHCNIPNFGAQYQLIDPDDLIAKAVAKGAKP